MERVASYKELKDGKVLARFGPTGASKILFALRPQSMIAWDIPIRGSLKYADNGDSYVRYLLKALDELESLMLSCQKHGVPIEDIPRLLGRDCATVAQMVGEYFWVTLTRSCYPPKGDRAELWSRWINE